MNVVVTGASGFTGRHLVEYLLSLPENPPHVWGLSRSEPQISDPGYTHIRIDLEQKDQIDSVLRNIIPDALIHLAGLNSGTLTELLHSNVVNTENLLRAVQKNRLETHILVIGSSAEYGYAGTEPITETTLLRPVGSYGVSKVAQDLLTIGYHGVHSINVAVARPFNLIGPGQSESFVCGRLARQAAEIQAGTREAFQLAGGDSRRDFIDVRDVANAYWRLVSHSNFKGRIAGRAFNIGSGKSYSVSEVIREISAIIGKPYPVIAATSHAKELIPEQISDNKHIMTATGWKPSIPLRQSLKEMVESLNNKG